VPARSPRDRVLPSGAGGVTEIQLHFHPSVWARAARLFGQVLQPLPYTSPVITGPSERCERRQPVLCCPWRRAAGGHLRAGTNTQAGTSPPSNTSLSFLSARNSVRCAAGSLVLRPAAQETPSTPAMRPWETEGCVQQQEQKELMFAALRSSAHPAVLSTLRVGLNRNRAALY